MAPPFLEYSEAAVILCQCSSVNHSSSDMNKWPHEETLHRPMNDVLQNVWKMFVFARYTDI